MSVVAEIDYRHRRLTKKLLNYKEMLTMKKTYEVEMDGYDGTRVESRGYVIECKSEKEAEKVLSYFKNLGYYGYTEAGYEEEEYTDYTYIKLDNNDCVGILKKEFNAEKVLFWENVVKHYTQGKQYA